MRAGGDGPKDRKTLLTLEHCFPFEKVVALDRWVDTFTTRFEQGLSDAWPDLAERLRQQVLGMTWRELTAGPGKAFREKFIEPIVKRWVEHHVDPIIDDACQEFRVVVGQDLKPTSCAADADGPSGWGVRPADVLEGMALPGGLLLGGGAVSAAITTVATLMIFTHLVVNWWLLIVGLIVAATVTAFGAARLAQLKGRLRQRFENKLLPKIREAIVGDGAGSDGRKIPSLKQQLQQQVRDSAARARKTLDADG
jgi:hypothetical protein